MATSRKTSFRSKEGARYPLAPMPGGALRCAIAEPREPAPPATADAMRSVGSFSRDAGRANGSNQPDLAEWARSLEARLAEQSKQLARLSRLKQFVPAQLVDIILSDDAEQRLKSHRREIVVVFVDLRGFTAFAETAAPEDVAEVLADYHREVGQAAARYGGTLERFAGDGVMIFFNDPMPVADPALRATQMALHMRARLQERRALWRGLGYALDFGIGIAQGYATVGAVGFEGRLDYAAIGTVTNLANRICSESKDAGIWVTQRVAHALGGVADLKPLPELSLKGFTGKVRVLEVVGACDSPTALRV